MILLVVGEIVKAGIRSKVSEQATSTGVRVCTWGQDPRKIFADIGQAVGRAEVSKLYVSGKLVVPGRQPAPDPGARPERTRKFIKALLKNPLKCFSLHPEGRLIIPSSEEIAKACPVSLTDEHEKEFASWRNEFPRPAPAKQAAVGIAEGVGGGIGAVGGGGSTGAAGNAVAEAPKLAPGTQAENEGTLKDKFGMKLCLKSLCPKAVLLLLCVK